MSQRKSTLVIYLLKKASHHFITIWSICVCATKLLLFMDPPHMLTCHFSKRAGISIKGYDLACSTRFPTLATQVSPLLLKSAHFCRNPPLKSNPIVVLEGVKRRDQNSIEWCRLLLVLVLFSQPRIHHRETINIVVQLVSMVNVPKVGQRTERGTIVDAIYEAIIQQSRWSNENLLIS